MTPSEWTRPEITLPPSPDYALRIRHTPQKKGWEQTYLLTSDEHWDSPECYIKLLHKHLRQARERNALWISNGDFFDAISGRGDKRASKGTHIEEVNGIDYMDRLVDQADEEFAEHQDMMVYMGTGNHEQSATIRTETDIIRRLLDKWNDRRKTLGIDPIHRAGYTGWIRFLFEGTTNNTRCSYKMKLEHGTGGNSPVTKGVIQTNRRQVRTEGASFFVSGHIHEQWLMPQIVERLNESSSRIELKRVDHIQLGSYKMDFRPDGVGTWAMQKMGSPRPIGGCWLRFYAPDNHSIAWEVTPTQVDYANISDYLRGKKRIVREAEPCFE